MQTHIAFWRRRTAASAQAPETKLVWPWSARLVWAFFLVVTEVVIFEDVVRHGAEITTKHLFVQAVLIGTYYFAHMFWPQLKQRRIIPAALSLFLACVGSYMVFVLSAGRNSDVATQKALAARQHNEDRKVLEANVAKADAERTGAAKRVAEAAAHQAKADGDISAACQGGVGTLCLRARADAAAAAQRVASAEKAKEKADAAYYQLYGKLGTTKPQQVEDSDIKAIAALLATLPWVTASKADLEAWHKLGIPVGMAAFAEIALMVSASIRKRAPVTPKRSLRWAPFGRRIERTGAELAEVTEVTEVKALPAPDQGGSGGQAAELPKQSEPRAPLPTRPQGKLSKTEAEAYVVTQLALGRALHGQDALAERCGVSISTMSDWIKEWEERGLVRKAKVGKRNAIMKGARVGA